MKLLANICGVVTVLTIVYMAAGRETSPDNSAQVKKDMEALQGKWQVSSHEEKGLKRQQKESTR
jgi:hypothetical protein